MFFCFVFSLLELNYKLRTPMQIHDAKAVEVVLRDVKEAIAL